VKIVSALIAKNMAYSPLYTSQEIKNDDTRLRYKKQHKFEPIFVINRKGEKEKFDTDKVQKRIESLCEIEPKISCDTSVLVRETVACIIPGMRSYDIDNESIRICSGLVNHGESPDYYVLGSRLFATNIQKICPSTFFEAMQKLYEGYVDNDGNHKRILDEYVWKYTEMYKHTLNQKIDHTRDFNFDIAGLDTLKGMFLTRVEGKIIETPQYLFMRAAIGLFGDMNDKDSIYKVFEVYDLLSQKKISLATPLLKNMGTHRKTYASCYLVYGGWNDDLKSIYQTKEVMAMCSKAAGGVGVDLSNLRGKGSYIRGTDGYCKGLCPLIKTLDMDCMYVDQGGNNRRGAYAIYLADWHIDFLSVMKLKSEIGTNSEYRVKYVQLAVWASNLFLKRVFSSDCENRLWTFFCPDEVRPYLRQNYGVDNLNELYGETFEKAYTELEENSKIKRKQVMNARDILNEIINIQVNTGVPYFLAKDECNIKNNQKNIGTIKSSNLCTEIMEYTSKDEVAVCNLSAINIPEHIENGKINYQKIRRSARAMVDILNRSIDLTEYVVRQAENSNLKHRPIAIGVVGFADALLELGYSFESEDAYIFNVQFFSALYYYCLERSMELAVRDGPYITFKGSPFSEGILQFDMWKPFASISLNKFYGRRFDIIPEEDWNSLREKIKKNGIINSLLTSIMPTATTSLISGTTPSVEPCVGLLFNKNTKHGKMTIYNKRMISLLHENGFWNRKNLEIIKQNSGSVQNIPNLPESIKKLCKTCWEIPVNVIDKMMLLRGPFIDQGQSHNIFIQDTSNEKIQRDLFRHYHEIFSNGGKNYVYYTKIQADQSHAFTVHRTKETQKKEEIKDGKKELAVSCDDVGGACTL